MSRKYGVMIAAALLLLTAPFVNRAVADDGAESPTPEENIVAIPTEECATSDQNDPCAGDGTGVPVEEDVVLPRLPETGV